MVLFTFGSCLTNVIDSLSALRLNSTTIRLFVKGFLQQAAGAGGAWQGRVAAPREEEAGGRGGGKEEDEEGQIERHGVV